MNVLREVLTGASALSSWLLLGRLGVWRKASDMTTAQARATLADRAQRLLRAAGIRLEVTGTPPPPEKGCVVVYNETSFADTFAFNAAVWERIDRQAVDEVYGRVAFGPAACERLGLELVRRKDRAANDRLLTRMAEAVRAGERVAWGGEGGYSGSDTVRRFKVGASIIALRAGAPLVPLVFRGGQAVLPLRGVRMRPGVVRMHFGEPISTSGLTEADARALSDCAHEVAVQLYQGLPAARR